MKIADLEALSVVREQGRGKLLPNVPRIGVGLGTCGAGNGAHEVFHALSDALDNKGVSALLTTVGCFGFCAVEPLVNIWVPGSPLVILAKVTPDDAPGIVECLASAARCKIRCCARSKAGII